MSPKKGVTLLVIAGFVMGGLEFKHEMAEYGWVAIIVPGLIIAALAAFMVGYIWRNDKGNEGPDDDGDDPEDPDDEPDPEGSGHRWSCRFETIHPGTRA
jgi:hypothetical protein